MTDLQHNCRRPPQTILTVNGHASRSDFDPAQTWHQQVTSSDDADCQVARLRSEERCASLAYHLSVDVEEKINGGTAAEGEKKSRGCVVHSELWTLSGSGRSGHLTPRMCCACAMLERTLLSLSQVPLHLVISTHVYSKLRGCAA